MPNSIAFFCGRHQSSNQLGEARRAHAIPDYTFRWPSFLQPLLLFYLLEGDVLTDKGLEVLDALGGHGVGLSHDGNGEGREGI